MKYVFDAHTSKARRTDGDTIVFHLWRVNVKTTGGFICISLGDFHIDKTAPNNNITNCAIIKCRPPQQFKTRVMSTQKSIHDLICLELFTNISVCVYTLHTLKGLGHEIELKNFDESGYTVSRSR